MYAICLDYLGLFSRYLVNEIVSVSGILKTAHSCLLHSTGLRFILIFKDSCLHILMKGAFGKIRMKIGTHALRWESVIINIDVWLTLAKRRTLCLMIHAMVSSYWCTIGPERSSLEKFSVASNTGRCLCARSNSSTWCTKSWWHDVRLYLGCAYLESDSTFVGY